MRVYQPPPYFMIFAFCIDDSLPKYQPDNWIKKNHCYRVKFWTDALNTSDELALTLVDSKGNEIHPKEDGAWSFKSNRFTIFEICLN